MLKNVHDANSGKVTTFGKSKLHCSSGIFNSPWIILVEGRADILNLLRAGYDNALGIEGARIDESIKELCDKKDKVVAFLDGDRAGGFILKELRSVVNIDVELRADEGVEVEELTPKRIDEILKPVAESMNQETVKPKSISEDDTELAGLAQEIYPSINESLESVGIDSDKKEVFRFPISELV